MATQTLLLGIDVGTTGSKAVLIDTSGGVIAEATSDYAFQTPQPLWAEQDPEQWWQATVTSVRAVLEKATGRGGSVLGIGLTGQMHGLVLLDRAGRILRPCIMWNDQRSGVQCAQITERVGRERVLRLTGNPVLPGFTAPKLLWVEQNEPDIHEATAHVLLPKDYVRYRLTGEFLSDVSDASGTSLFDVAARTWSDEMLQAADVPRAWLPDVTESVEPSARITDAAARETGLPAGTRVVAGAGDQAAQAVGTGIVDEGAVSVTLGTSGVVFAAAEAYRPDPDGRLHAFCHAVPDTWHLMGVMLSAGGSFRWFRDTFCQSEIAQARDLNVDPYQLLATAAKEVPPGCDGLLFLPYLTGERTPHPDPHARGVFFGVTVRHTKAHFTRAVMEGVVFGLRDSLELIRSLGVPATAIRASGGGARSETWLSIVADVFGTPIDTVNVTQGAAYGAALLAGVGTQAYPDVATACRQAVRATQRVAPGPAVRTYAGCYERYRALYPALRDQFAALADTAMCTTG